MLLWICPCMRISLLKPPARFILCVGSCFNEMLIRVSILRMRFGSFGCDDMYRFMMESDDSGFLDILKACR